MAPIDWWHKFISRFHKQAEKKPALSTATVALLSIALTVFYVIPFYLSDKTRPSPTLARDAPSSIQARIRAVTISGIISCVFVFSLIAHYANTTAWETLALLGWWPISVVDIGKTVLLTAILFAGPLFEAAVVEGGWKDWITGRYIRETLGNWIGYRNYIVGPISEELIWRSLLVSLHLLSPLSSRPITLTFIAPLYFGIAHAHHYYEFRVLHPSVPRAHAIIRSLFQFTYTSLFGFYATFVFLRNRSLLGVILAHSFCNWMGLPRVWGRVGVDENDVEIHVGPPVDEPAGSSRAKSPAVPKGRGVAWTVAYYVLLVAGAVGFWHQLRPLTESGNALADFWQGQGIEDRI